MHEHAGQLADKIQSQVSEMVDFAHGLSDFELQSSCPEDGATVIDVINHVANGYGRATTILRSAATANKHTDRSPGVPLGDSRNSRPQPLDDDFAATVRRLQTQGAEVARLVRRMPDAILCRPLSGGAFRSVHVGKPLSMVIEYMIYQQAAHLDAVQRAVTSGTRPSVAVLEAGASTRDQFQRSCPQHSGWASRGLPSR
jgi:hypothetical protein